MNETGPYDYDTIKSILQVQYDIYWHKYLKGCYGCMTGCIVVRQIAKDLNVEIVDHSLIRDQERKQSPEMKLFLEKKFGKSDENKS